MNKSIEEIFAEIISDLMEEATEEDIDQLMEEYWETLDIALTKELSKENVN